MVLAGMALIACLGTWGSPWGLQEKREQLRAEWRRNQAAGHLQVLFVDVAQGSSTLLGYPDGTNMLVDGGGFHDDAFDVGRNVLAPLLWYLGIDKLDTVVLSHDHPDHGNGLRFILSHFRVGSFWESGIRDSSKASAATDLAAIAANRGIPHKSLEQLQHTPAMATRDVRIRHPSLDYLQSRWDRNNLNNVSLVIEAMHGDTRVLLPGDIDQTVEGILANELRRPGRVLLAAPHHGSQHSSGEALLDSLKPEAVVFSCGYGNWFGFPHETVLQRLRDRGTQLHRTDQRGCCLGRLRWSFVAFCISCRNQRGLSIRAFRQKPFRQGTWGNSAKTPNPAPQQHTGASLRNIPAIQTPCELGWPRQLVARVRRTRGTVITCSFFRSSCPTGTLGIGHKTLITCAKLKPCTAGETLRNHGPLCAGGDIELLFCNRPNSWRPRVMRYYFFGDIHGNNFALERVLTQPGPS